MSVSRLKHPHQGEDGMLDKEKILKSIEDYIDWDRGAILVVPVNTAVAINDDFKEAWKEARPSDANKASFIGLNGAVIEEERSRWFEPKTIDEGYAVAVCTKNISEKEATLAIVREFQHCLDHQLGVLDMPLLMNRKMGMSFKSWSDFRAGYSDSRMEYFLMRDSLVNDEDKFNAMASILGSRTARALVNLQNVGNDVYAIIDGLSPYMGAQKSIQTLAEQELGDSSVFKLWQLTPSFIVERYGTNYYHLANAWKNLDTHPVDITQKEYKDFRNYLSMKVSFKM